MPQVAARRHSPGETPIEPAVDDDLPRAVAVRLTVHRRGPRRRIDTVVLSAAPTASR